MRLQLFPDIDKKRDLCEKIATAYRDKAWDEAFKYENTSQKDRPLGNQYVAPPEVLECMSNVAYCSQQSNRYYVLANSPWLCFVRESRLRRVLQELPLK